MSVATMVRVGGLPEPRGIDEEDNFEMAVVRTLGGAMKEDPSLCTDLWCALANRQWTHTSGETARYTWRAAGDMIAAVIGRGDYMEWYGTGPEGVVSDRVRDALAQEGWTPNE